MGKVFSRFCAYILYIFQFEIVPHLYYIWDSCTQTLLLFLVFILLRTFIYIFNETNCVMRLILKFYGISTGFISLIKKTDRIIQDCMLFFQVTCLKIFLASSKLTNLCLVLTALHTTLPFASAFIRVGKKLIFNPIQHGMGQKVFPPLLKICHTHPTMMKLGTLALYLKKIQKIYESRDTSRGFC